MEIASASVFRRKPGRPNHALLPDEVEAVKAAATLGLARGEAAALFGMSCRSLDRKLTEAGSDRFGDLRAQTPSRFRSRMRERLGEVLGAPERPQDDAGDEAELEDATTA